MGWHRVHMITSSLPSAYTYSDEQVVHVRLGMCVSMRRMLCGTYSRVPLSCGGSVVPAGSRSQGVCTNVGDGTIVAYVVIQSAVTSCRTANANISLRRAIRYNMSTLSACGSGTHGAVCTNILMRDFSTPTGRYNGSRRPRHTSCRVDDDDDIRPDQATTKSVHVAQLDQLVI